MFKKGTRVLDLSKFKIIKSYEISNKKRAKTAINRAILDLKSYKDIPEITSLIKKLHFVAKEL